MDHVRPNFQSYWNIRCARRAREASRVVKQRFIRTYLDQYWRKTLQVGVERRNARILPVHPRGKICVRQFT